ncbi:hypothetical protein O181_122597 [Austropuccinia psidii MF-1]|uniref:Uncharacterized protein n=1 Tax=Austropuccinia psidii MF-1 TaxID=1389203 RepID=A0A9Q3KL53_9BASI|nr:hypothetical protein [Austropuccinia psidii MF-1]
MSSKLTSICDSNHSDSPPSVLYVPRVFDNLRELYEESTAPKEIYEINKIYDGFKYVRVIEPACINFQKTGVPCIESTTDRSTRCQFCNLRKKDFSQANHSFPDSPRRFLRSIKKGARFGLEAPVDEPPTSDATSGHSICEFNGQQIAELLTSMVFVTGALLSEEGLGLIAEGSRIR